MKILITGATGFLGQYIVKLLASEDNTIYYLTRSLDKNIFSDLPNVIALSGDITHLDVIRNDDINRVNALLEVEVVIHAAALYDLEATHSECFLQNVVGTQNIIHLMDKMIALKAFYHISTIAVGDSNSFFLDEKTLPPRKQFNDFYSETKYLAEQIVRESALEKKYVTRIIRPGIVIGDSKTKLMPKIDGPYYFIEAFKKYSKILRYLPVVALSFNPRSKIPMIPVDHCTEFLTILIKRDDYQEKVKTYHLISDELPTIEDFLGDLNKAFGLKTVYIPVKENVIHRSLLKILGVPKEVIPFMFSRISYDKTNTLLDLPEIKKSTYSSYKDILFKKI